MKICINNVNINFEVFGQGEPIIVLHGWNEDCSVFKARTYRRHLKGYKVYAVDLPGFGESDGLEDYSFEALNEVLEKLVDSIGLEKFELLGQCMGGIIALDFAIRHKERVTKLTLIETMIYFPFFLNLLLVKRFDKIILGWMLKKKCGVRLFNLHRALRNSRKNKRYLKVLQKADVCRSLQYIRLMKDYSRHDHIRRAKVLKMPVTLLISSNTFKQVERTASSLFKAFDNVRLIKLPAKNHFIFG